jgi:uncharacterized membrane protein YvbJ
MKLCPYCAEEIQDAAIKCKYCGEFLNISMSDTSPAPLKWYFKTISLLIIIASVGPFGLPLIWWHPQLKLHWKVIITIAILIFTWMTVIASIHLLETLKESYAEALKMMNL